ncbi:hypothetical protein [Nitrosopumilus sp.]|uniref:hypothetical protein n=1 Tax=Nitrosopumilus sp. TaxID=2024843 RepID=UPI0034A0813E
MTQKPEDEAKKILEVVDKYFPKIFDGKQSITWLRKHTTQGGQIQQRTRLQKVV